MSRKYRDNGNRNAKLDLRRYFLRKYHASSAIAVLDCCQAKVTLWRILSTEFTIGSMFGMDQKRQRGRLTMDSRRFLSLPGWTADVVDVDTYGSPWGHWAAMLPNIRKALTVFLTVGKGMKAMTNADDHIIKAAGIAAFLGIAPRLLLSRVEDIGERALLAGVRKHGLRIVEAREVVPVDDVARTRYLGLRLEPIKEGH